jgi:peptidoglycan hydrolase-like amidase/lysophospholipase L1-like esterase
MYAKEISNGTFEIYGSSARACPGASSLSVPNGPLSISSTFSSAVREMQQFIDSYHNSAIDVDGYFGSQTKSILVSWQQSQSLPADGIWNGDDATRARAIISSDSGGSFTLLGTETTSAGNPVRFTISNGDTSSISPASTLGVCRPDRTVTHYRGAIDVLSTASGNRVVNDVKAEDYLRGVVPKEISASWASAGGGAGANAVRAQAVAARSYGLVENRSYFYDSSSTRYATTCDSTSCQVYAGAARRQSATGSATSVEHSLTDAAIAATSGIVRKWPSGSSRAGQLVRTEFSASNGPRTAGGEFPPVNDIGDDTTKNPNHRWTRVIDADTLEVKYGLGQLTSATMANAAASQYQGYDGIWFNDIVLTGTNSTKRMQAWDFRNAFGLPSPGFTVRVIRENSTSNSFGLVGDSVGRSIASSGAAEFDRLIDGTFTSATISAQDSRCTARTSCAGSSGVQVAQGLPFGLDLVVVELGYNDSASTFAGDIDAMMTALTSRGVQSVAWVNMADIRTSSSGSVYGPMNASLRAAQARWPNLTALDWNAASDHAEARARWFSDGVHLTTTGQAEFALWLHSEIVGLAPSHFLAPPKQIELSVVGRELITPDGTKVTIPASATSVAINVTTFMPVKPGVVTVWPCESERRETSNLNNMGRDIVANNVIASVDDSGSICLWSNVGTDIIVDVTGWFEDLSVDDRMVSVSPERIVDTRKGLGAPTGKLTPSNPLVIDIAGVAAELPNGDAVVAPADVRSVALNITSVNATGDGYFTVWPCATDRKETSSLNFVPGKVVANGVVTAVDENGQVCVYAHKPSDLVVDVQGWFGASSTVFTSTDPTRIVDTRKGLGAPDRPVQPSGPLKIKIHGIELDSAGSTVTVPTSATAAVINVVAVDTLGSGFVTVWPCLGDPPTASNLNYVSNEIVANGVIAPINDDGTICLYTHAASDIVVDVGGWLSGGFVGATPNRFVDTRYGLGPIPV